MINYTFGIVITLINIVIVYMMTISYWYHKNCLMVDKQKEYYYTFHDILFYITGCLSIANIVALLIGFYTYFIIKTESPDIALFGRFIDRYTMGLAYIGLIILGRKLFRPVLL